MVLELSIIIVNYNVKYFLEQCLYSVFLATKGIEAEVFVVDNNSVDGSNALVREKFPQVKLIENPKNVGFSAANNIAIKQAKGKYVLLLNPDTLVQEDTFSKVIAYMNTNDEVGGLGIKMVDGKGNFLPESKRGLPTPMVAFYKIFGLSKLFPNSKTFGKYHLTYLDKDKNHEVDILSGAFMLMRKKVLDEIGLLDETFFMYGEDVDLSYRITLAGYKNVYFSESSIIHYKGESTKKSSVNYVIVFYKAMAIFAKKHFKNKGAGSFIFLIYLAIYLRAFTAIVTRIAKQLFFPAIDFVLVLISLYQIKNLYELKFKLYPNFYSEEMLNFAFPVYTCIWLFFSYLSGGYDYPLKLKRLVRGVLTGSAFILIIYSLLPEYYRFSRALIVFGTVAAVIILLLLRVIYHYIGLKKFQLKGKVLQKRCAIIGSYAEFERVSGLLKEAKKDFDFIGFVTTNDNDVKVESRLGTIKQVDEIISVHNINEIIFCAKDVSSQNIINYMLSLVTRDIEFKIAPPESLSIIGSNSIDAAGELYVIDLNNISKPENKRKKRLIDLTVSSAVILFFPVLIWIQKQPINYLINAIKVFFGFYTWVGYGKDRRKDLPSLRPSVLTPADEYPNDNLAPEKFNLLLLNYSKEYKVENDLQLIFKNLRNLGK